MKYISFSYPLISRGACTQLPAVKNYVLSGSFMSVLSFSFPVPLSWFRFVLPGTMAPFVHSYNQAYSRYCARCWVCWGINTEPLLSKDIQSREERDK